VFKEVSADLESEILASSTRQKRGPDYSIRTVVHWLTLPHKLSFCSVPTHYDNVPDTDMNGQPYDKYPSRLCTEIGDYSVCRWCYINSADIAAREAGLAPVPAGEDKNAPSK
jgi:hypothetical protein